MASHTRRKAAEAEKEAMERSSSDEEDSDSESEGNMNNRPPPKKLVTSLPHKSTDDDEDASDSDNDLQSNPIPKSVPEVNLVSTKKPNGESSSHAGKNTRSSKKRPAESPALNKGNDSKKSKKKKKKNEQVQELDADENVECENMENKGDDAKKQLFQRIWSEEDEITILNGMIDHGENEGINPATVDMSSFYDSIRYSLQVEASRSQLTEKIKRLKKKYLTSLKRSFNGVDRTFAKDHDQKCYHLSKKIWGTTASKGSFTAKLSRKGKNVVEAKTGKANMEVDNAAVHVAAAVATPSNVNFCIGSSLEKKIEEYGSQLITGAKKLELDNMFRQLQVKEAEVYLKHLDYMREKTVLLLEALRSNIN
ncbi:probable transcription factor At1g11510 [Impatiens glandulifera]|uniref:probable transcription factor At1g11510 n=1 Tax=Impatiens glandulifera TaxID=253017 RepID=UPI001FB0D73D|nr:probable transcription factor At1g11510 [Impatiens glandulifera]